ncbi:hypothetical protein Sdia_01710 [Streptomyces diastaticus subsp. diastaticus]|uniref:Uncharacterized protein n=1 Tax=Streptomyces diastaticus subsp. diastaticus TaxID=68040 RepID=A0ABQ1CH06_STRDI|nr:hypothetical protein Sdia_01710 [Streptomyces diastaticus subsp. diastaticus]GGU36754.1 hypothetical protein GCM10015534_44250 [Streptomyces diastaticus subsp. diastaticus]
MTGHGAAGTEQQPPDRVVVGPVGKAGAAVHAGFGEAAFVAGGGFPVVGEAAGRGRPVRNRTWRGGRRATDPGAEAAAYRVAGPSR